MKRLDNKFVTVISTFCVINPISDVQRWSETSKTKINVLRPNSIGLYNKGMGGVDLIDMLVGLYRVDIRGKQYYLRIIFQLSDVCIVNAWILYKRHLNQLSVGKILKR